MVTKLDRLARSLPDARAIADELTARQISLPLGGSVYDPTDAVGRLLFNVLAMVAEFESDLIRLRTREGMKVAKAKGRLRGKQPKLNQEAHVVSLVHSGEYSTAEVADLFGVGRSTVYRAIQRRRNEARGRHRKVRSREPNLSMSVPHDTPRGGTPATRCPWATTPRRKAPLAEQSSKANVRSSAGLSMPQQPPRLGGPATVDTCAGRQGQARATRSA